MHLSETCSQIINLIILLNNQLKMSSAADGSNVPHPKRANSEDEVDLFTRLLAIKLQQIHRPDRESLMRRIFNLVFETKNCHDTNDKPHSKRSRHTRMGISSLPITQSGKRDILYTHSMNPPFKNDKFSYCTSCLEESQFDSNGSFVNKPKLDHLPSSNPCKNCVMTTAL